MYEVVPVEDKFDQQKLIINMTVYLHEQEWLTKLNTDAYDLKFMTLMPNCPLQKCFCTLKQAHE